MIVLLARLVDSW